MSKIVCLQMSLSNETQVMLRKLEFNMAGNYSCEVSADAPSFATSTMTGHLDVYGKITEYHVMRVMS